MTKWSMIPLTFIASVMLWFTQCNHTPTITINGTPGDVVIVTRSSLQRQPCCRADVQTGGFTCVSTAPIVIDIVGIGFHDRMGDDASYNGNGLVTGCTTSGFLPACGDVTMDCAAQTISLFDPGDPCLGGDASFTSGPFAPNCSPIIVDTVGQGFQLTSADQGVLFDIRGDGHPVHIAWTARGSSNAFLALDRNHNGRIDNGMELFGNFTPQPASAEPNGFLALATFDKPENGGNGDGIIDAKDAIYKELLLWIDENHDGVSEPGELHTLPEMGVLSLSLNYEASRKRDEFGNLFRFRSKLNPSGSRDSTPGHWAFDVFLTTVEPRPTAPTVTSNGVDVKSTFARLRCQGQRSMNRRLQELRF